jgi:hypothetical protein
MCTIASLPLSPQRGGCCGYPETVSVTDCERVPMPFKFISKVSVDLVALLVEKGSTLENRSSNQARFCGHCA